MNDIIVTSADLLNVFWFKKTLAGVFKVKDLGETQKILDIWVTHNCKRQTLCLNQIHYMNKVLRNLHMHSDKHKITKISLNRYDALWSADLTDQRINQRQYQQTIESLMYVMIHIQLNIVFVLDWLSQYLSNSAEHHGHTLKRLLQYVRSIINLSIVYGFSGSQVMLEYSDSDYTSDKQDHRSILRYVYMLKDESVSWTSCKQKSVITLITETEYIIMSICAKTEIWLIQVLKNMSISKYLGANLYCVSIREDETH